MSWRSMSSHIQLRQQGTLVGTNPAGSSLFIFLSNRTVPSGSPTTGGWGTISLPISLFRCHPSPEMAPSYRDGRQSTKTVQMAAYSGILQNPLQFQRYPASAPLLLEELLRSCLPQHAHQLP